MCCSHDSLISNFLQCTRTVAKHLVHQRKRAKTILEILLTWLELGPLVSRLDKPPQFSFLEFILQ